MSSSLVPSLILAEKTELVKLRELPLKGKILVQIGQQVIADQIIAEAEMPGDLLVVKLVEQSGLDLDLVMRNLTLKEGEQVEKNQLIFQYKTFFGLFETNVLAPISGQIEFISQHNAHVGIRGSSKKLKLQAYLAGTVKNIIGEQQVEIVSQATFVQGIFGVGGERFGEIKILHPEMELELLASDIPSDSKDKILVSPNFPTWEALEAVKQSGAAGLILGSIDNQLLTKYLGYELGLPITGGEVLPFTLIITEGFGDLHMSDRYLEILGRLEGSSTAINGATQIRAGAVRPEIIVANTSLKNKRTAKITGLEIGAEVKVIRYPYFGMNGKIINLPVNPELIETGAMVRVAELELEDRRVITVPRTNIEII